MSGGVDSSIAALLLKKQGHEVIGAFMKNWSDTKNDIGECTWRGERRMAQKIATILNIPLITLDFEKQYRKLVVDKMYKLYKKGITPNPDIDCNEKVKFPLLLKEAKKLKCDFIATGHYARINEISKKISPKRLILKNKYVNLKKDSLINNKVREGGRGDGDGMDYHYELLRAKDESKDQSYFLYRLKQKELSKVLFPIGNLTKSQVREIAHKNKFPNYDKKSTVGICFIGKVNLKRFLQKKIKPKKGKILDPEGKQIGEHDGIYYYTIGQRIGPRYEIEVKRGFGAQKKWYVARKILKTNTIIAAPEGHNLNFRKDVFIKNVHWINNNPLDSISKNNGNNKNSKNDNALTINSKYVSDSEPNFRVGGRGVGGGRKKSTKVLSRIRQVGELLPSILELKNKKLKVTLKKPITGVSEGQAIVLYQDKKCLGGGIIAFG